MEQSNMITIPYRTYGLDQFVGSDAEIITVEHKGKIAYLEWEKKYFSNYDHVSFYAGSEGWQPLTETGYYSYYPHYEGDSTIQDIKEWFATECDNHKLDDYQHQGDLF